MPLPPHEAIQVEPLEAGPEATQIHGRADYRVLKEHEGGAKTADEARKHGISEATIYN